jgi:hypothetical protein
MLARHYAPKTPLEVAAAAAERVAALRQLGKRVAWLTAATDDPQVRSLAASRDVLVVPMPAEPRAYAACLYATLHAVDRRSLDPLLKMLRNPELTPLTRAFAAVALGGICDKDPLPWNTAYATQTNYRAATATLTDGQSGILDIL